MSGDYDGFAAWLRERAVAAGFDLDARGGIAKLSTASGIDPAQMSRALRGLAVPAIEGQRGLAKALGIKLPEVMIRAGSAQADDFPDPGVPDLATVAENLGVPAANRERFVTLVEMVAGLTRDPESDEALPHLAAIIEIVLKVSPRPRPPGTSGSSSQTGASPTMQIWPDLPHAE